MADQYLFVLSRTKRPTSDQKLVDNLAREYLTSQQLKGYAAMVGKTIGTVDFSVNEMMSYPFYVNNLHAGGRHNADMSAFLRYILTFDRLVNHMRTLDNIISQIENGNRSDAMFALLRENLPPPDWIPEGAPRDSFYNIKSTTTPADTKLAFLLQFNTTHAILALTQGSPLENPLQANHTYDVIAAVGGGAAPLAYHRHNYNIGNIAQQNAVQAQGNNPAVAGGTIVNGYNARVPYVDAAPVQLQDVGNGGVTSDAPTAGTKRADRADALRRCGGTAAIYSMFNRLLAHYLRIYRTNDYELDGTGVGFLDSINRGSNFGSSVNCPAGMTPFFVGHDGNAVDPKFALIERNGKYVVNTGAVDLARSGCRPTVALNARRTKSRAAGGCRQRAMAINPRQFAARATRDARGRFVRQRAMTIPFKAGARTLASYGGRIGPWNTVASVGDVNPVGADTAIDYKKLAAGMVTDDDEGVVQAPTSSTTEAEAKARRARRKKQVSSSRAAAHPAMLWKPMGARRTAVRKTTERPVAKSAKRSVAAKRKQPTIPLAVQALLAARRRRSVPAMATPSVMRALQIQEQLLSARRCRRNRSRV